MQQAFNASQQRWHAGKYEANQKLVLARYVMSPSQRTLLTMHAEVTSG